MDGEVLAHVSRQLGGPVGPDALGGPGLSGPGQPLVPDLGRERPRDAPGGQPPSSQLCPETRVSLVPLVVLHLLETLHQIHSTA